MVRRRGSNIIFGGGGGRDYFLSDFVSVIGNMYFVRLFFLMIMVIIEVSLFII